VTKPAPSEFPALSEPTPRLRRRTARGTLLRWGLRGVVAALLALLVVQIAWNAWDTGPAKPTGRQSAPSNPRTATAERPTSLPLEPSKRKPSPARQSWESAVVAIESRGSIDRRSHGSGFLVAGTGLVATNLHVAASCTEAVVRLADGATYEVAGYAAVDPAHDLALLALKGMPTNLAGLSLANSELSPRQAVWAIGHPQGIEFSVSVGEVSRIAPTSDLPEAAQRFLRELAPGVAEARWIQHSAMLSPGSSGGPLVDGEGHVLGINTWIDQESHFSYALHVEHLVALLPHAKADAAVPLVEQATTEARVNHQLWQLSADRLRSLLEQGRGMKWQPRSLDDYRILQQLAWAITVARLPDALAARGTLGDRLDELARAADAATAQLRKEKWNRLGQVTILNEYAEVELRRPRAGLFFFATIERVVDGDDGRRGLVATLAGFDQPLFLALTGELVVPEAGSQCLVLGVNDQGRLAQWRDQAMRQVSAPIIVPGAIVRLDEE